MINSGFLKLNFKDLGKGLSVAVIVALLGALQQAVSGHGFDFASFDWAGIMKAVELAFTGYVAKNLFSNEQGKFLGRIG